MYFPLAISYLSRINKNDVMLKIRVSLRLRHMKAGPFSEFQAHHPTLGDGLHFLGM